MRREVPMATRDEERARIRLLESEGYKYNFQREIFINRTSRIVFSIDFLEDCTEDEFRRSLQDSSAGNGWKFYPDPPPAVRRELEKEFGG
jgi:hypothetical protein